MRRAAPPARLIAVVVLLAALLSRALIPAGWMPSPDGGPLVICTGHGPVPVRDERRSPTPAPSHDVCAFAVHASGTPPSPPAVALSAPIAAAVAAPTPIPAGLVARPGPARAQSPRAPPAFA